MAVQSTRKIYGLKYHEFSCNLSGLKIDMFPTFETHFMAIDQLQNN